MEEIGKLNANVVGNMGISVVIPNYNGKYLLQQNLPFTFAALKSSGLPYEVIVTDDASSDDSTIYLNKNYPDVIVIENNINKGFSVNINSGIVKAKFNLVLLLNSDIKLDKDYFLSQLKYFENDDTFGVMGKVLDEQTGKILEACKYPQDTMFKINAFTNLDLKSDTAYSYYLSGANALVNRRKILALGGFNELYSPFYHEDIDLSLRAWENGWKCYYDSLAVCRHAVSTTIKAHSSKRKINTIGTRNKFLLHYLHHTGMRLYLWQIVTLLSMLIRWASGKIYYYPAYMMYLKMLPDAHNYKLQFFSAAKENKQYIPFINVKEQVKKAIDNIK
jgi:GT2 family glycosyltransferase